MSARLVVLGLAVWLGVLLILPGKGFAESFVVFESDGWTGMKRFDSEQRIFSRCSVSMHYVSGTELDVSWNRHMELELWLENDAWELEEGTSYPVRLQVDQHQILHARAEAEYAEGVYIYVRKGEWFFNLLKKGRFLKVFTQAEMLDFDLTGSATALNKMRACTVAALKEEKATKQANPFEQKSASHSQTKSKFDDLEYTQAGPDDVDTKAFALNALMMPSLRHYETVPSEEFGDKFKDVPVVWRGAGSLGIIFRLEGLDLEKLAMALTLEVSAKCDGPFDSSKSPFRLRDGGNGMQVQILCHGDEELNQVISLYPAEAGGYFAVINLSKDTEDAQKAASQFHMAVEDMMRGF